MGIKNDKSFKIKAALSNSICDINWILDNSSLHRKQFTRSIIHI